MPEPEVVVVAAPKNWTRRLYDWTLHWAHTRYGVPAMAVISFFESSIFPIPPDVLLMPLCFARPERWMRYAFWCTFASVLGAILGWCIGAFLWEALHTFFFTYVPGFSAERFEKMGVWFREYGFWIVLVKGLTPIPFKLITISAGVFHMDLAQLIVASIISRAGRFYLVAGLIRAFGPTVRPFLEQHLDKAMWLLFLGLVVGVLLLKFLH